MIRPVVLALLLTLVGPTAVLGAPTGDVVLLTVEDFRLRAGRSLDGGTTFADEVAELLAAHAPGERRGLL